MATNFDYENFAQNLASQAVDLVPADFDDNQKQYVINTLGNFATMAGQTLATDPNLNFNEDQAITITQIIAEWSFHKSVDVIRSGIPQQYWDGVLQKIAYTIFEICKQAFSQELPSDKILELVEHHVKKTYLEAIKELKDKNIIDESLMEFAASQSNMDKMAQEMQQPQQAGGAQPDGAESTATGDAGLPPLPQMPQPMPIEMPNPMDEKIDSKTLKLATLALVLKKMEPEKAQPILGSLNPEDAQMVIKFMQLPTLIQKIGALNAMRGLKEIKSKLPKATELNSNKVVQKLRKITSKYNTRQIESLLANERTGVKRLVFMAIDGEYYNKIPTKVASIVATYLQSII